MKRAITLAAIAATILLGPTARAQTIGTVADEAAIRALIVEMTDGFNSHDAKAASAMYTPDAWLVTVRGDLMNGRAAIEKGLGQIFATRAKNAAHRTQSVNVRFVRPDVALAHVVNELSGLVAADGQALPA